MNIFLQMHESGCTQIRRDGVGRVNSTIEDTEYKSYGQGDMDEYTKSKRSVSTS